ncbi:MAG: Trp biosynthesis-associated membrane protein [Mycobacteriaceae bacterium]
MSVETEEPIATDQQSMPRSISKKLLTVAVLVSSGALCLWVTSRMRWVELTSEDGLGEPKIQDILGSIWWPGFVPLALVLLVTVGVLYLANKVLRYFLAIIISLSSVSAFLPVIELFSGGEIISRAAVLGELPARSKPVATEVFWLGPSVSIVGAFFLLAAVFFIVRIAMTEDTNSYSWSSRYNSRDARRSNVKIALQSRNSQSPNSQTQATELGDRLVWDSLDMGKDPTAESVADGRDASAGLSAESDDCHSDGQGR